MAPSLAIQEIWDEILDYHSESPPDLRSLALVCRAFVTRAQVHLFHDIHLVPSLKRDARTPAAAARRLKKLMAKSPHLIHLARTLLVQNGDEETFVCVAEIRWTHLRKLKLGLSSFSAAGALPALVKSVGYLVGLDFLRSLVVQGRQWTPAALQGILACCNPRLEHIELRNCISHYSPSSSHDSALYHYARQPTSHPRTRVTHLTLVSSSAAVDLLTDPRCALDFSSLARLWYTDSVSSRLAPLLRSAEITHLYLLGTDHTLAQLDTALFPALTHLEASLRPEPAFNHFLMRLHTPRRLAVIRLVFSGTDVGELAEFEAIVLGLDAPSLRRVELGMMEDLDPNPKLMGIVEAALPRLRDRGLLCMPMG
ncbi:hypothetical protein DFH06DRAFT_1250177 [Mycena polygramma]|nr:hypothetical protein DFH06DRAFT_1250177 [Mycena polygramma]